MPRLSLVMRLSLLVTVVLAAVWILAFALQMRNQAELFVDVAPAPERLLAIISTFDVTASAEFPRLIEALDTERLSLEVSRAGRVPPATLEPAEADVIAPYKIQLGERLLGVFKSPPSGLAARFPRIAGKHATGLVFYVALPRDELLVATTSTPLLFNRFGFPVGFGAGLFGTVVAFLALLLIRRETTPLRQLAVSVDTVDFSSDPIRLPEARYSAPEIRGVIAAFNRLQQRLHVVMKARMALIGGISHDVRTFAARLRLRVEAIEDEAERQRAETDISDMIRLLDDALLSSRAGAGELQEELVDIGVLATDEVEDRRRQHGRIDFVANAESLRAQVLGDRLALRRVMANLIDNALKYGSSARLQLAIHARTVVMTVDDDGPGIAEHQRQILLEPFVRLEPSRNRKTGGAGLGLAIAHTLVLAHKGSLEIAKAPMGGARIVVRLPLFAV